MNNGKVSLIGVELWSNLRCEIKQTVFQSILLFLTGNTIHCSQIMLIIALEHIFFKYASKKNLGQLNSSQLPAIQMSCPNYRNPVDTYCLDHHWQEWSALFQHWVRRERQEKTWLKKMWKVGQILTFLNMTFYYFL